MSRAGENPAGAGAPPGIAVRPCTPADAHAVAALLNQLAEVARPHAEREDTGDTERPAPAREAFPPARVADFLRYCRDRGETYANCAAELDGRVVGFLSAVFYRTPFHPGGTCLINELVVDERSRGRGAGRALLDHLEREALRRGMDEIEVGTEKANRAARRFYRASGFDDECILLGRHLEG